MNLIIDKDSKQLSNLYLDLINSNQIKPFKFDYNVYNLGKGLKEEFLIKSCIDHDFEKDIEHYMWLASPLYLQTILNYRQSK